jgi:REP element-mobilizing transposase RayT
MSRPLRFIPEGGALVEVTCRTLQARFLLRPSPQWNSIALGVLGRAQRLYGVQICVFSFVSNHYHLLLRVRDAHQMASFMRYLNTNLAKEAGRIAEWREKIFSRRYQAVIVSDEAVVQVERFRYILAHGCKEGLVERLRDWPGAQCVQALLQGARLEGKWFDRTKEHAARQRGEDFEASRYAEAETVCLDPLPCWQGLSDESRRQQVQAMVDDIEASAARKRQETRRPALGVAAIYAQHPHARPVLPKKSPAPRFHEASRSVRQGLTQAYRMFVAAFRESAGKLRAGDRLVQFPLGCFPPALPFVE